VLFDKMASVYFISKIYIHILALEMASPVNKHCANCIGTLSFIPIFNHANCVDRMRLYYCVSSIVLVVSLLARPSDAAPLSSLWSTHTQRDLVDSLARLDALRNYDSSVADWRRDRRRSEPPNWLGTQAAGTAWDAYVRMLRQEQLDVSDHPHRTSNPVNFLGKRAAYFN